MGNSVYIAAYFPFAVTTAAVFVIELKRRIKWKKEYLFLLLCLCSVCWFACNITGIMVGGAAAAKFFYMFSLAFVGFIPPILLLFTLKFYRVGYYPRNTVKFLLFLIPIINTVMAVSSNWHNLMTNRIEIASLSPVREVVIEWGPWFWIHTSYSYILSITLVAVILYRHFNLPRFYRMPSRLMVVAVFFTLIGNLVTLIKLLPQAIDPTLMTLSVALVFYNLAIVNNNRSKFVRFSYKQIYHYLDILVLILDGDKRVLDYNRPAGEWFLSKDIALESSGLNEITEALLRNGNRKSAPPGNDTGTDFYIVDGEFPLVLNLREHELRDDKKEIIGYIAILTNVTQNRTLLEQLEAKAGMDSLTGLPNHTAFVGAKRRLDTQEYLPLCVIMCDVNGLKEVNDSLGHQYGDMMLRSISEILEKRCPKSGFVARIGGDEFIFLLPNTDETAAREVMAGIRRETEGIKNLSFELSLALGLAEKSAETQDIDKIIALADIRMYENKRLMKQNSGE